MSEAKHTPGPWKPGYRLLNVVAENAKIGGETPVCDIRGWGYLTGKGHGALGLSQEEAVAIQTANANLIAAAPDMLVALTSALIWHEEQDKSLSKQPPTSGPNGNLWARMQHQEQAANIRAVIAKAEGSA